jgi:hypothetical protein
MFVCRMVIFRQKARKSVNPCLWRPLPPEVVNSEPSDSSSDSKDEVSEIIEVSSDSKDEGFLEFDPNIDVEPEIDLVGPGELDFEDPEADRRRKKTRAKSHDSDTSDASNDYEIVDPAEDKEKNLYAREDPYLFITESERDFDSEQCELR